MKHMSCLLPRLVPFKGCSQLKVSFVGMWKNKMLGKLFFYTENFCRGSEDWPCLGSVIDGKRKAEITWLSRNFQAFERIARPWRGFWCICLVLLFLLWLLVLCVQGLLFYYFGGCVLLFGCCFFLDFWSIGIYSVYAFVFFFSLKLWDPEISF